MGSMRYQDNLLSEVEHFLSVSGMGPTYFGKVAANNTELVRRLRAGRRVWPETAEMVRDFIRTSLRTSQGASE